MHAEDLIGDDCYEPATWVLLYFPAPLCLRDFPHHPCRVGNRYACWTVLVGRLKFAT